jgi:hypothetical protein
MIVNSNMVVQKRPDGTIISQARILAFETHLIVRKNGSDITPISILKYTSSGLLNTLPSLPTNPPTYIT